MNRREKREQREREIVAATIRLFSERGFLDIRMSDIAKETGYAMGTIYSHFESKEDLLVACAYTLCLDEKALFNAIVAHPISDIEKIITLAQCSWLISSHHPDLIEIDNLSLMPSIWRRATAYRAERLNQLHVELANIFLGVVLKALEQGINGHGRLTDDERQQLATYFAHGMWGLCVGLSSTAQSGYASTLCPKSSRESYAHFTTNYANFLKGYGWQEHDPDAVFARCMETARHAIGQTTWYVLRESDAAI